MRFSPNTISWVSTFVVSAFMMVYMFPFAMKRDWSQLISWKFLGTCFVVWIFFSVIEWWIKRTLDRMPSNGGIGPSAYEMREFEKDMRKRKRRDPKW